MATGFWKALGVFFTCAAYFAFLCPYGWPDIVVASFCAIAVCGVIELARREDLTAIRNVAVRSLVGATLGLCFLSPVILYHVYLYDHGFAEGAKSNIIASVIGAVSGTVTPSLYSLIQASQLNPYRTEAPNQSGQDDPSHTI